MKNIIAFIGFGEAAFHIAKGLKSEGVAEIVAYDIAVHDEERKNLVYKRASEAGVVIADNLEQAVSSAKFVAALTSAGVAVATAKEAFQYIKPGQVYVDMNSCAPTVLTEIEGLDHPEGTLICDVAILNSVPTFGHKVKMCLSGNGAKEFYEEFKNYHMNLKLLDAPAGGASAIKMFKSVFTKGFPQIMLEAMLPAAKYGVLSELMENVRGTFNEKNVEEYTDAYLCKTLIHAKRRVEEMENVADTLEGLELDASMTKAVIKKLKQLAEFDYAGRLGADAEFGYQKAVEMVLNDYISAEDERR